MRPKKRFMTVSAESRLWKACRAATSSGRMERMTSPGTEVGGQAMAGLAIISALCQPTGWTARGFRPWS